MLHVSVCDHLLTVALLLQSILYCPKMETFNITTEQEIEKSHFCRQLRGNNNPNE